MAQNLEPSVVGPATSTSQLTVFTRLNCTRIAVDLKLQAHMTKNIPHLVTGRGAPLARPPIPLQSVLHNHAVRAHITDLEPRPTPQLLLVGITVVSYKHAPAVAVNHCTTSTYVLGQTVVLPRWQPRSSLGDAKTKLASHMKNKTK